MRGRGALPNPERTLMKQTILDFLRRTPFFWEHELRDSLGVKKEEAGRGRFNGIMKELKSNKIIKCTERKPGYTQYISLIFKP